jgi:hypothetical protein
MKFRGIVYHTCGDHCYPHRLAIPLLLHAIYQRNSKQCTNKHYEASNTIFEDELEYVDDKEVDNDGRRPSCRLNKWMFSIH